MIGSETDDNIDEPFESLLQRFQKATETSKNKGSELIHENFGLLHYIFPKISLKRGKWYIKSSKCLENKTTTISPKNNDDNCFHYAIYVALNRQNNETTKEYGKLNLLLIIIIGKT